MMSGLETRSPTHYVNEGVEKSGVDSALLTLRVGAETVRRSMSRGGPRGDCVEAAVGRADIVAGAEVADGSPF